MAKEYRVFRQTHAPATPAHELERSAFNAVRSSCSYAAVVDAFIDQLATNCWRQYDLVPGTFYGFKADSGHWVILAPANKELITGLVPERASKLYMELKSGVYGYSSYRSFLDALRPEIESIYQVDIDRHSQHLKVVLQLKTGALLELDISQAVDNRTSASNNYISRDRVMPRVEDDVELDGLELGELEEIL